jgi:hypothetical protein
MTKPNKFAGLVAATQSQPQPVAAPEPEPVPELQIQKPRPTAPAAAPSSLPDRMLGGRVPDSIFREFQKQKMAAEESLGVRRVTTEEALEAFVRMIRTPDGYRQWLGAVAEVQQQS